MKGRTELMDWLLDALKAKGDRASILEICKFVWDKHKKDLEDAGDLFYTWQYDIRWAANELRNQGKIKNIEESPKGIWELTEKELTK